jgi:hypothetical protein
MMTIDRRITRLEHQLGSANRPRPRIRLMVVDLGSKLVLEDATCQRSLSRDGTLMELVEFRNHREGPDELTSEELDRWVEGFPVRTQ